MDTKKTKTITLLNINTDANLEKVRFCILIGIDQSTVGKSYNCTCGTQIAATSARYGELNSNQKTFTVKGNKTASYAIVSGFP